jgi:transcriptional regulator with XRE-family HTH domain
MKKPLRIRELRIKKNLSVSDFADQLGYNRQNIYSWETGKTYPSPEVVKRISEFFEITVNELYDENQPIPKQENWFQVKIDELQEEKKRLMDHIERLTRLLENATLGKCEDCPLAPIAPIFSLLEKKDAVEEAVQVLPLKIAA